MPSDITKRLEHCRKIYLRSLEFYKKTIIYLETVWIWFFLNITNNASFLRLVLIVSVADHTAQRIHPKLLEAQKAPKSGQS